MDDKQFEQIKELLDDIESNTNQTYNASDVCDRLDEVKELLKEISKKLDRLPD